MKIHEYQAKAIFKRYGIPVPQGVLVSSAQDLAQALSSLQGETFVAKAQIHAGGRGKAGGVRVVKGKEVCAQAVKDLLGRTLVTPQTGPAGKQVRKVWVEEALEIAKEFYAALTLDRWAAKGAIIASSSGGMSIEEVAAQHPDLIFKRHFDVTFKLSPFEARQIAFNLTQNYDEAKQISAMIEKMAAIFLELDASLVEINPLVAAQDGKMIALDAKIDLDDNSLFRHPDLKELRDAWEEDPREDEAKKHGLSYVGMDGNVGCMVNGAGLAMATMDAIRLAGGMPANFLDVGGGANVEQVKGAFQIILRDEKVKAILVNIFGGIMKCDVIAEGILGAVREMEMRVPLVVRLEGTRVKEGRSLLAGSGLKIHSAEGLQDAARKAVELAGKP
jgi:succinyl-CoA synthetase beta subunit